jgi:hypothetical protein
MQTRASIILLSAILVFSLAAAAGDMKDCPMMAKEKDGSHAHTKGVQTRGDEGMGFSHEKTTHHFRLKTEGGSIEVTANDPSDHGSRDQIRMHLGHIAQSFEKGDFAIPMFVHDTIPPGVKTMKRRRTSIAYRYEEIDNGALVSISTTDADALDAIHDFLRFQIVDHETGDPLVAPGVE